VSEIGWGLKAPPLWCVHIESCAWWVHSLGLCVPAFADGYLQDYASGAWWARDKMFFVRIIECWLNAYESDMSQKFNATENLWFKGIARFSSGGETTDCAFQLSVILQEIRYAWWKLALLLNECLICLDELFIPEEQIERVRQWTTYPFWTVL